MAAKLPDIQTLYQAGINPKTGLPLKAGITDEGQLKNNIKHIVRLIDEQDAVNRYTWYNLPCNITGQELERMLYYKGQLAFFYIEDLDEFYFMPYALDGTIDFYGRFNSIHPVPMTSGTTEDDKAAKQQADYLSTLKLKCVYGLMDDEDVTYETMTKSAVLIHDYTKGLSQMITPRSIVNDGLIDVMSDCVPFMRTALLKATGVNGVRVNDADQAASVLEGAKGVKNAALNGETYVPIVGNLDFQELADGTTAKAEEYLLAMQALDNLRLSTFGIDNGGLFQKKAHELQAEANMASANVGLVYQDGLAIRQHFCNIVNSIWDIGIWCEASENITKQDHNGDGALYERNDEGTQSGVQGGNNNVNAKASV